MATLEYNCVKTKPKIQKHLILNFDVPWPMLYPLLYVLC
jgi:hypothetical protein